MTIDEFIEEKIAFEEKRIRALRQIWNEDLREETDKNIGDEVNVDDMSYDQWETIFSEEIDTSMRYYFDSDTELYEKD